MIGSCRQSYPCSFSSLSCTRLPWELCSRWLDGAGLPDASFLPAIVRDREKRRPGGDEGKFEKDSIRRRTVLRSLMCICDSPYTSWERCERLHCVIDFLMPLSTNKTRNWAVGRMTSSISECIWTITLISVCSTACIVWHTVSSKIGLF